MTADAFSSDYVTARARFRDGAARIGWALEAHPVEPVDHDLTIDVACSPAEAERVLVVSSGTHGVEGFFGSAVQLSLLDEWANRGAPANTRVVLIHAVNPYGFAHLRRTDATNVDLNRNFVIGGHYGGVDPTYARLDPFLNPRKSFASSGAFRLRMLGVIVKLGRPAVTRAVAMGQYDFPQGLFFGGRDASAARLILEDHLPRWIGAAREVVHLDLHTGLGRWSECRLLADYPMPAATELRAAEVFGDRLDTLASGRLKYAARGVFSNWCVSRFPDKSYLFAYAEVGTYRDLDIIEALRAENQLHHFGGAPGVRHEAISNRLKELFCPADEEWRDDSLMAVRDVVHRALEKLK